MTLLYAPLKYKGYVCELSYEGETDDFRGYIEIDGEETEYLFGYSEENIEDQFHQYIDGKS